MLELEAPLAVVCHDAGATNLILAWLGAAKGPDCRALMQGPAAKLWAQAFGSAPTCASLEEALSGAALLLSGTGWASDLEHEARKRARERGVRSIGVVDHWVNYRERFSRHGLAVYPDELWVSDEYALAEARRCFPDQTIRLQENLYLADQLRRIPALDAAAPSELLYVLEPTRNDWGRGELGELQALDFFASHIGALRLPLGTRIRLRPHPSDPPGKYDSWIARHLELGAVLDDSVDLGRAVGRARWVVGCESFALVLALHAGRQVVCTLPPWAPPCRLPHHGLIHLKQQAAPSDPR
jgi:hypothetical protein